MIRRRQQRAPANSMEQLVSETSELVGQLLRENRALRTENLALKREVERLSAGWEDIRRLARAAPRANRSARGRVVRPKSGRRTERP